MPWPDCQLQVTPTGEQVTVIMVKFGLHLGTKAIKCFTVATFQADLNKDIKKIRGEAEADMKATISNEFETSIYGSSFVNLD